MIDLNTFQIFADHLSNLKETSIDKRDGTPQYMTLSTRDAVNFDDVKEEYVKQLGVSEIPKSNDALFDDGKVFWFLLNLKMDLWIALSNLQFEKKCMIVRLFSLI